MRTLFIVLAGLSLAGAAFFLYDGHHQQQNRELEVSWMAKETAAAEEALHRPGVDPASLAREIESAAEGVTVARDSARHFEDQRNISYGLGAGGLLFAAGFGWLARRKPRAVAT